MKSKSKKKPNYPKPKNSAILCSILDGKYHDTEHNYELIASEKSPPFKIFEGDEKTILKKSMEYILMRIIKLKIPWLNLDITHNLVKTNIVILNKIIDTLDLSEKAFGIQCLKDGISIREISKNLGVNSTLVEEWQRGINKFKKLKMSVDFDYENPKTHKIGVDKATGRFLLVPNEDTK